MLSSKNRLNQEVVNIILKQKTGVINTSLFFVKKVANNINTYRFAVIIPKKIYKKSTDRHKFKRKIINTIKNINNINNFDYVITLKKDISSISNDDIYNDLVKIVN